MLCWVMLDNYAKSRKLCAVHAISDCDEIGKAVLGKVPMS